MSLADINYLAVLVAALIQMVLGALWYSPMLFGKAWMRLSGMTDASMAEAKKKGMVSRYLLAFIGSLVAAYVLAYVIDLVGATTFALGMQTGFLAWLGFVATVTLGGVLWENKSVKLYLLNNAYQLVALILMGGVLAAWQ